MGAFSVIVLDQALVQSSGQMHISQIPQRLLVAIFWPSPCRPVLPKPVLSRPTPIARSLAPIQVLICTLTCERQVLIFLLAQARLSRRTNPNLRTRDLLRQILLTSAILVPLRTLLILQKLIDHLLLPFPRNRSQQLVRARRRLHHKRLLLLFLLALPP